MNTRSLVISCVALMAYVLLGGLIFHFLERDQENTSTEHLLAHREEVLRNFTCIDAAQLARIIDDIIAAHESGITLRENSTSSSNWGYQSSVFFAVTVVTTIGYGNIAPMTSGGRIFCILFAFIGIPLFLVTAGGVGEKIAARAKKMYQWFGFIDSDNYPKTAHCIRLVILFIFPFIFFMSIPAAIFQSIESWSYGESIYYTFITLTTIGLGDYVPGIGGDRGPVVYHFAITVWILVGLAWMAGFLAEGQQFLATIVSKKEEDWETKKRSIEKKSVDDQDFTKL